MTDARTRLALICGMFGSHHIGERAAAAAKAHEIVKELGVAWNEIFVFPEGKQELAEIRRYARKLLKHEELFSEFEIKFLNDLKRYTRPLSQKQRAGVARQNCQQKQPCAL